MAVCDIPLLASEDVIMVMEVDSSPNCDKGNIQDLDEFDDLNYIDSVNDSQAIDKDKRTVVEENYDKIIAILISAMAKIRWQMQDFEKQIEVDKKLTDGCIIDLNTLLAFEQAYREFYRIYIRVMFFRIDVCTALKYLMLAKTDWDYRFFARRIYTLMYETGCSQDCLLKIVNKPLNDVKRFGNQAAFENVVKCRKELTKFMQRNQSVIYEVRKNNEAHKSEDTDKQFAAVERLSVKESRELIDEYQRYMASFFGSLTALQKSLDEYNRGARTVCGIAFPMSMTGLIR